MSETPPKFKVVGVVGPDFSLTEIISAVSAELPSSRLAISTFEAIRESSPTETLALGESREAEHGRGWSLKAEASQMASFWVFSTKLG